MTACEIAHILTITPDPANADEWTWKLVCPYEEPDMTERPGRPCVTSVGCRCVLTDAEKAALYKNDVGPCSQSRSGVHRVLPEGWGYDVDWCWARTCDDMADQAANVHADLGCGTFLVAVVSSWETVEVAALANVDEVVVS